PHRHTSASTSGEKAEQAARPDCGSTGERTGRARSKSAANLFTIPLDDKREAARSGGLVLSVLRINSRAYLHISWPRFSSRGVGLRKDAGPSRDVRKRPAKEHLD